MVESNPFRLDTPDAARGLGPEIFKFFDEQQVALRSFADKALYGSLLLPESILTDTILKPLFPVGVSALFLTSQGVVRARLVELGDSVNTRDVGRFVYYTDVDIVESTGAAYRFAGYLPGSNTGGDSVYGWVIYEGVLPIVNPLNRNQFFQVEAGSIVAASEFIHGRSTDDDLTQLIWPMTPLTDTTSQQVAIDNLESQFDELALIVDGLVNAVPTLTQDEIDFRTRVDNALTRLESSLATLDMSGVDYQFQYLQTVITDLSNTLQARIQTNELLKIAVDNTYQAVLQSQNVVQAYITDVERWVRVAASNAGTSAQYSDESATQALAAFGYSQEALTYRDEAGNYAASASASAGLISALYLGSINDNPRFLKWTNPLAYPDNWAQWALNAGTSWVQAINEFGQPCYEITVTNTTGQIGIFQDYTIGGLASVKAGWYVIEGVVKLVSGSLSGAAIHVQFLDASNTVIDNDTIDFTTDPSSYGVVGAGTANTRYYFSKLTQATGAVAKARIYVLGNWASLTRANKVLRFETGAVRAATPEEIANQTTLVPLVATVSTLSGTVATIDGSAAFYEILVAAGGGYPAVARLKAGNGGSDIELVSQKLSVYNVLSPGTIKEVARFEGGNAVIYGNLRADSVDTPMINGFAVTTGKLGYNSVNEKAAASLISGFNVSPGSIGTAFTLTKNKIESVSDIDLSISVIITTNDDFSGQFIVDETAHGTYYVGIPFSLKGPGASGNYIPISFIIRVTGLAINTYTWRLRYQNYGGSAVNTVTIYPPTELLYAETKR